MSTSPLPDPIQLWREAVAKMEGNVNTLVAGSMESKELMGSLHQLSAVSLGMQQAFEKAIGSYLGKVNLPSRKDVLELAAALQRVEDKLDRLLPKDAGAAQAATPRPARTRRPPGDSGAASPVAVIPVPTASARPEKKRPAARKRARS